MGVSGDVGTARVPRGGLPVWDAPDAALAPSARADGGLAVRVIETDQGWSRVEFSNGWAGWVDGRRLVTGAARTTSPLPAIGAVAMVVGGLLPWMTAGTESASAWDVPLWTVLTHRSTTVELWMGYALLIPLVALVPYLTRRALPRMVPVALGTVGLASAIGTMLLIRILPPGTDPGYGLLVTFAGGALMTCEGLVTATWRRPVAGPRTPRPGPSGAAG